MITLKLGSMQMTLPDRLIWPNEFGWSPVVISQKTGSTGALIIHVGKRKAGRPIILDGVVSNAWMTRADCDQLYTWAAIAEAEFELVLRGIARTVRFDNDGFTATALWRLLDGEHDGQTVYLPSFKFIEV
ncbi:hypothetical protein [Diaphorobacter caeni]|uniref:hypothetical protein n=1 Tax=Diaphorobacter caeni TaxID=2784387 RepID=UPI00189099C4|nr:hypothetical protein [Diaphorobacter caeni]MBF5006359.1 hypothetical protein [Diaphorobacter caeni]